MPFSRHPLPLAAAAALLVLALGGAGQAAAASKPAFTSTPGPANPDARFAVSYTGSGTYKTRFHATPPNQGGKPDTNDAWDSSTQSWKVRFTSRLAVPTCGAPPGGGEDPCSSITGLSGATGPTSLAGRVNHKHVDGLYRQLDRTVKCRLGKRPSSKRVLDASLLARYIPESGSIAISTSDPIATAVSLFPPQCPKEGEPIDRILDFYAMPGFSFADAFGPEVWFASREVVIPSAVFHRSRKIVIPLRATPAGIPPRHCKVRDPSFERCTTGGSWRGALTLSVAKPAHASAALARAATVKVKAPRSGQYKGSPRGKPMSLFVAGKEIQVAAFSFTCADTTGRTSIDSIPLKKTRKGYKFGLTAGASITFADGKPDENGKATLAGRFAADGKSAKGTFRVKSRRCHDTGTIKWKVRR